MYQIVIADDETSIRNGIACLIDWKALDCEIAGSCSNGAQVLELVKNQDIQIVVSDIRMPVMDGLRLAEILHRDYPDVVVLILTAYSDFNYARQALKCGVSDYIIKNDFMSELPAAIEKTKEKLKAREKRREEEKRNEKNRKTYVLEALVFDRIPPVENGIEVFGLDQKQYCVCLCEFSYEEGEKTRPNMLKAMENFLGMASHSFEHYLMNTSIDNMTILFCRDRQEKLEIKDIFILFSEILHIAEEFLRISIKVGISRISGVNQLHQGYEQAKNALFHSTESGNEILFFNEQETVDGWDVSVGKRKQEAVKLLFGKKYAEAEQKLEEWKRQLRRAGLPLETIQANVVNLCSAVFRALDEQFEVEDIQRMEVELYNRIYNGQTLYQLLKICDESFRAARKVLETNSVDKHYLVNAIDAYIRENYCSNNLTLQQISEAVHASTSYISRLYKKKTGRTLTSEINRLRMQKAKELLSGTTCKIYEIAEMVGIEDAGYFTSLFIKYEGCSPSEYRGMPGDGQEL